MNNSAAHTELKANLLITFGARPGLRLFNNPVGAGWIGKPDTRAMPHQVTILQPRRVVFGLCPGSADLIGWREVTITPDMVGTTIAQFVAPEVKTGAGRTHDNQPDFLRAVARAGGLAGTVRSLADMEDLLAPRRLL